MKDLIKSITKKEWRFFLIILIIILIVTSLTRIFLFIFTPDDLTSRGNVYFNFTDRYVYVSYVEQIKEGAYLIEDLYTAKGETAPMLNIFWLGSGLFARFFHLSGNATLEILRVLMIPFLLFSIYLLFAYFIKDIWQRKMAFLIGSLGGGLGLIFFPFIGILEIVFTVNGGQRFLPIDMEAAEAFIFNTCYYSAHFVFSTFLFVSIILISLLAIDNNKLWYALPAGIMSAILLNFHPFTFIIVFFIFLVYFCFLLWQNRRNALVLFKYGLLLGIFVVLSFLYHAFMFFTPWWQEQTWRSTTRNPYWLSIISGYGIILLFAIYSLYLSFKEKIKIHKESFLLIWLIAQICLLALPVSVQGRFLEGYWIVLVVVASYSLALWLQKRKSIIKDKIYCAILFFVFFMLSAFFVMFTDFYKIYYKSNAMYIKRDAIEAMRELKSIVKKDELILADIANAGVIPGIALRRVFVGHGVETINFSFKFDLLNSFMKEMDTEERKRMLINNNIKYLFYDDSWREAWSNIPDNEYFLEKIYEKRGYIIYRVNL